MSEGMTIKAIAPWFGGKRTLAPEIVRELGPHNAYWEPFCGSMAVLMAKAPCKMETVNDLHGDLINLARCLQSATIAPGVYRRLRRLFFHEDLIGEAKEQTDKPFDGTLDPERAYWFFVRSWVGRNGVAGTKDYNTNFCRRFTSNGGGPATRLASAISSIPAWRRRMRCVQILRMDGFDMLDRLEDKDGAAIYVDPPYITKSAKYVHDFSWKYHRRLALALGRFHHTRVVVSYYEHPDLNALYPTWTRRAVSVTKAMCSQGQRDRKGGAVIAPEVLLINGPSYAQEDE